MFYSGESDVVLAMKINSHVTQDYTLDLSTMKMENEETGLLCFTFQFYLIR